MGWECPCGASNADDYPKRRACGVPKEKTLQVVAKMKMVSGH